MNKCNRPFDILFKSFKTCTIRTTVRKVRGWYEKSMVRTVRKVHGWYEKSMERNVHCTKSPPMVRNVYGTNSLWYEKSGNLLNASVTWRTMASIEEIACLKGYNKEKGKRAPEAAATLSSAAAEPSTSEPTSKCYKSIEFVISSTSDDSDSSESSQSLPPPPARAKSKAPKPSSLATVSTPFIPAELRQLEEDLYLSGTDKEAN